MKRWKRV